MGEKNYNRSSLLVSFFVFNLCYWSVNFSRLFHAKKFAFDSMIDKQIFVCFFWFLFSKFDLVFRKSMHQCKIDDVYVRCVKCDQQNCWLSQSVFQFSTNFAYTCAQHILMFFSVFPLDFFLLLFLKSFERILMKRQNFPPFIRAQERNCKRIEYANNEFVEFFRRNEKENLIQERMNKKKLDYVIVLK